jgi:hypothetical protein
MKDRGNGHSGHDQEAGSALTKDKAGPLSGAVIPERISTLQVISFPDLALACFSGHRPESP